MLSRYNYLVNIKIVFCLVSELPIAVRRTLIRKQSKQITIKSKIECVILILLKIALKNLSSVNR